jgi:sialate O-acetylesterase
MAIRGAIWYQGESNAGQAWRYRTLFSLMIRDWRRAWGQGDFPFLFVQLANYRARKDEPAESDWAELREAQNMALALPHTGVAVTIDIGEGDDIHPRNKQDVGKRLARWALAKTYGHLGLMPAGPIYRRMTQEGAAIHIEFTNAEGLTTTDGQAPRGFAVAGEDREFVWADAEIHGSRVVVSHPAYATAVAVRYGWADNPDVNLVNADGLPASPFRTDDWPGITVPKS